MSDQCVDFDSVRKNAAAEGIPLSEICLFYAGLSAEDVTTLRNAGALKEFYDGHRALGAFCSDGSVVLEDKVTGVHYLAG